MKYLQVTHEYCNGPSLDRKTFPMCGQGYWFKFYEKDLGPLGRVPVGALVVVDTACGFQLGRIKTGRRSRQYVSVFGKTAITARLREGGPRITPLDTKERPRRRVFDTSGYVDRVQGTTVSEKYLRTRSRTRRTIRRI